MCFKYDDMGSFLLKISSSIEIASCICYGIDLEAGPQVSDVIPYLEHHAIRTPITEKLEEDLSKKVSKHHTTLLHDNSSSLTSWLNYVRPSHDLSIINVLGADDERNNLVRDLLIYSSKEQTKFILLNNKVWYSSEVTMFDHSEYNPMSVVIGETPFTLFYLDIVFKLLNNTSDKN